MDSFYNLHPVFKILESKICMDETMDVPQELKSTFHGTNEMILNSGFLAIVDPDRFRPYFALFGMNPENCFPFIKSAFGVLIFFHENKYKILNPVYNYVDELAEYNEFEFLMDIILCDKNGLNASMFMNYYFSVYQKLGIPEMDECFAFIPAFGLGGELNPNNIVKTPIKEQMLILSQV